MSTLDLKQQRTSSSWQARWLAGLFSLLLVTAGIAPAYTPDSADTCGQRFGQAVAEPHGGSRNGPPSSTADAGRATSREVYTLAGDGVGSRSMSDPDIEEYESDLSASPALQLGLFASATDRFAQIDAGSPNGLDASGRPSPRAPPLA